MKSKQTFGKFQRILTSKDYSEIWRKGKRYHTPHLIFIVSPGVEDCRLGMTISRKVGNAVCRNRLKRWTREFFRRNKYKLTRHIDISIVAKRHAGLLSHIELDQELHTAFARLETEDHA